MTVSDLLACVSATWSPTIGDPSVMGWVTVVAYVAAGGLAALACRGRSGRRRAFWLVLAVILLALALNKQLDLQSALTATGRCLAKAEGWYARRRPVQVAFIVFVIATGLLVAAILFRTMRRDLREVWLALIGIVFLLAFIAIRAAGFHHFDRVIGHAVGGVRVNWILELGGIAMIATNAAHLLLRRRTGMGRSPTIGARRGRKAGLR